MFFKLSQFPFIQVEEIIHSGMKHVVLNRSKNAVRLFKKLTLQKIHFTDLVPNSKIPECIISMHDPQGPKPSQKGTIAISCVHGQGMSGRHRHSVKPRLARDKLWK